MVKKNNQDKINNLIVEMIVAKRNFRFYLKYLKIFFLVFAILFSVFFSIKNKELLSSKFGFILYKFNSFIRIKKSKLRVIVAGNKRINKNFILNTLNDINSEDYISENDIIDFKNKLISTGIFESISVTKFVFQDIIIVNLKEKNFVAVIEDLDSNDRVQVIDDSGLISYINSNLLIDFSDLMHWKDYQDDYDYHKLYEALQKENLIRSIKWIKFYDTGRYDIMFINDLLLMLPRENVDKFILKFIDITKKVNLKSEKIKKIDLRIQDSIFIER